MRFPRIFKDPDQQNVALEAVKLLILFAISPVKVRYTARHMAEMILFRVTDLEVEINYQYRQGHPGSPSKGEFLSFRHTWKRSSG